MDKSHIFETLLYFQLEDCQEVENDQERLEKTLLFLKFLQRSEIPEKYKVVLSFKLKSWEKDIEYGFQKGLVDYSFKKKYLKINRELLFKLS